MWVARTRRTPVRFSSGASQLISGLLAVGSALAWQPVMAVDFNLLGVDTTFSLTGSYALAMRIEEKDDAVIDTAGRSEVPIAEELKFPESNNFDDGDRNFDKYSLVNNRVTLIGELEFAFTDDIGIKLTGDAFYDDVYKSDNDNDSPESLNTRQEPHDTFTDAADFFSGGRARVLDAYAYGTFYFGDTMALDLKAGKHVAAWGESLFFSGVALAMGTADATKATVPGADVKSILLPENQASFRFTLTDSITLLGQYQFEHRPTELNPTGEYFSVSDIVGPGAEFAYGIKNPLYPDTLAQFDLTDPSDLSAVVSTIDQAFDDQLPDNAATIIENALPGGLPSLMLPETGANPLNAPRGLNPERLPDIVPDDGQYGFGIEYDLNFTTSLGLYHLNYHSITPAPVQNFGSAVLARSPDLGLPPLTTGALNLKVPVTYNVRYFNDIKLSALSFSSVLFGANIGGELIHRDGVDVLVDVDNGVAGPVPTPTRADSYQMLLNGIYLIGPQWFWDAINIVGELGYIHVDDVQGQPSQEGANEGKLYNDLTFDDDAGAFSLLAMIQKKAVFPGWDLEIPISVQGQIYNRSAVAGAFGSLLGEDDYRLGIGVEFTRLQKLTLGLNYNGFLGGADFLNRPLQDRDTLAFTAEYNFF